MAGNAYVEMMLVLPILIMIFLGLATVTSLFLGKMAVSQAAEAGAQAVALGQNTSSVDQVVDTTLSQEGYTGASASTAVTAGTSDSVTVSLPYALWDTGTATTISAVRTLVPVASSDSSTSSSGSSSSSGGGGYVYHHFPMW